MFYKLIKKFKNNLQLEIYGRFYRLSDGWNTDYIIFYGSDETGKNLGWAVESNYFKINKEVKNYLDAYSDSIAFDKLRS